MTIPNAEDGFFVIFLVGAKVFFSRVYMLCHLPKIPKQR